MGQSTHITMAAIIFLLLSSILLSPTAATTGDLSVSHPANITRDHLHCPDYGIHFGYNVIVYWDDIFSWQECGILCHETPHCTVWSWTHLRSQGVTPRRCYLHYSGAQAFLDDRAIAGSGDCYTSCPP